MKRLGQVIDRITNISGDFSGWLLVLLMLLVLAEVFMRYAVGQPLGIADEFGAYILVAAAYIGGAYTFKQRGHVRITALVDRLPQKVSSWFKLTTLILAFGCSFALSLAGYKYLKFSLKLGMRSSTWVHTPLQLPHLTVAIGFSLLSLMLIVEIARAIASVRSGTNDNGAAQ